MEIRDSVTFGSSAAKRADSGMAGHGQSHVNGYQRSRSLQNIPVCKECGKNMKIEWSDSITGNKQIWCCDSCFHYRIVKPSFRIEEVLHRTLRSPYK